jgi:hypothetical protein
MKPTLLAIVVIFASAQIARSAEFPDPENLVLHYDTPAKDWEKSGLPIGNGQMGAMLLGNPHNVRIQFNEESLWLGNEDDTGMYQNFGELTMQFDEEESVTCPSGHIGWGHETLENIAPPPARLWRNSTRAAWPTVRSAVSGCFRETGLMLRSGLHGRPVNEMSISTGTSESHHNQFRRSPDRLPVWMAATRL